ncbi:MAG: LTA synthase family protein [Prevotella sp.]
MKQRIIYLILFYLSVLLVFIVQKTVFFFVCAPATVQYGWGDWWDVVTHGLLLDVPTTGYLMVLPLLAAIVMIWTPRHGFLRLRRWLTPYYAVVAVVVALVFVADASLYPFWKFKLDATVFIYLDSPKGVAASVSAGYIVWRVVLWLLLAAAMVALWRCVTPLRLYALSNSCRLWHRLLHTLVMLVLAALLFVSIRGGLGESTANIGKVYYAEDTFLNHAAVNPVFSMIYSIDKTQDYGKEFRYFDEAECHRLFEGMYPDTASDTVSLLHTKRPNIIIILLEGFGGKTVAATGGSPEITPHYNRLCRQGVLFSNCYSNSYRTDRGMLSALSGYASFPNMSVMKVPAKSRTLPCVASTLDSVGYRSSFLYGGDINFTNMQSYLRTGGYGTIVSDVDFPASQKSNNHWGYDDDVTFDRLFQMMQEQKHTPWHIGFLTLSSHEPWVVPYRRLEHPIANAFAFTDECLGRFVEKVRRTPLWGNLLIVCLPDHGFAYPDGITREEHHHNTMLWIGGAVKEPRHVTTLMNQSDLAATLLGQLGIPHKEYVFSRDVLSDGYRYPFAFFSNRSYIGLRDSTGFTVFDIVSGKPLEDAATVSCGEAQQDGEAATLRRITLAKAMMQSFFKDLEQR